MPKKSAADSLGESISTLQKAQALISTPPVTNGEIKKAQALADAAIKLLTPLLNFKVSGPDDEVNKKRGIGGDE